MSELWLKFTDSDGTVKRIAVESQKFVVGRHSTSDLCIIDGRLSREHLKIERFGDLFMATDSGSSNGTKINGEVLDAPAALRSGDVLDLGGLKIEAELEGPDNAVAAPSPGDTDAQSPEPEGPSATAAPSYSEPAVSSIPTSIFFIAPVLGLVVILLVGGLIYFTSGRAKADVSANDFQYSDVPDDPPVKKKRSTEGDPTQA